MEDMFGRLSENIICNLQIREIIIPKTLVNAVVFIQSLIMLDVKSTFFITSPFFTT